MAPRRTAPALLLTGALLLAGCGGGTDRAGDGAGGGSGPGPTVPPSGRPADPADPLDREALKDFNGDGYDDYATVLPSRSKDGEHTRSTLVVIYGSRGGLRPETAVRTSAGGDGDSVLALIRADLDGDGFTDLVGERGNSMKRQEAFALYGGPRGLSKAQVLGVPEQFTPKAAGDFDGDGHTDLLDGGSGGDGDPNALPGHEQGRLLLGPLDRSGRSARQVTLDLGQHGYASPSGFLTGDFDGDRRSDVILTYSFDAEEDESAPDDLTSVAYYRGGPDGLVPGPPVAPSLAEAMGDIDDGPRGGTVGDVDKDGIDDVVAMGESPARAGRLTVIHGARSGLGRGRAAQVITGTGSQWGLGTSVGDIDGDRTPDLLTGRPGFRLVDTDRLVVLPGGPGGHRATNARTLSGDDPGLPGRPARFDLEQPTLLDVNGDRRQDAVLFSSYWNKGKGAILVFPGTRDGLDAGHAQHIRTGDVGVRFKSGG
ncbi:FG-GAP repeat domain-containing protein [Streptomyces boluensis]|uniref:VCBS repeat-containing protein n=1 Tax=Streptomyces boluensis TaxID=1775135 RepID=A0A964UQU6_9ACTN|nr:VCBS repeat-containing protein [Streptomyces boluensis]NBE51332.1 VCBS repeat-containing protein [Streptomyces boluensis]